MIRFEQVSKSYPLRHGERAVLRNVDLEIGKGEKVGILGRNGAGKSTTIRLLSGAELPTAGRVVRGMSVSWPLAFGGAFQSSLTGRDNLRLICRIYGKNPDECIDFVNEFSELGEYLDEPVRNYSSGMSARLAFAISMVIEFDCFLIDEVVAVGDSRFHQKCHEELFVKRIDRSFVIVSHDTEYIRHHCDVVFVLRDATFHRFSTVDEAIHNYVKN
jgi:capsular polysaccharide transport system ATP-binding protein